MSFGNYPGNNQAILLYENQQYFLWQHETPVAGSVSRAVQLRRERGASIPFGASFEVSFSGDPGTFEVAVQEADLDLNTHFVDMSGVSVVAVNGSYVGRIDLPQTFWSKLVRCRLVTLTNAVQMTVMVSR